MKRVLLFVLTILSLAFPAARLSAQSFGDTILIVPAGFCAPSVSANFVVLAAAGAGTGPAAVGTNFAPTIQASSSAAAIDTIGCELAGMSRTSANKGLNAIAGFAFMYGIITTTATSQVAPACQALAMPAPAAGETASTVAGTNQPVTTQPVIGSANLTAVTAGQFNTSYVQFTTPPSLNTLFGKLTCSFGFGQTAASAMAVNSPGGIVFTTWTIAWMKQHGHDKSIDAMTQSGISFETANLIYALNVPRDPAAVRYMAGYYRRHSEAVREAINAGLIRSLRWHKDCDSCAWSPEVLALGEPQPLKTPWQLAGLQ